MPISGATRHDMTVGVPDRGKAANKSVGANEAFEFHRRKPNGMAFQRFGLVEELKSREVKKVAWTFDGVAATTYNPAKNESSRLGNTSLVVALAGPVTLHVKYTQKTVATDSRFKDVRRAVGDRGVVLRSTKNVSNGVDIILYDSFNLFGL